jgi:DNA invertase Pin-like site-specific DNA recombinase
VTALADLETVAAELRSADATATALREEMYARVRSLYEGGERPITIAEYAGITKQRVNQICNPPEKEAT